MESNESYSVDVTQYINAFLDRIERVLLDRGTPRAERTSICAEVESQIHTLIERRVETGAEINLDIVAGIIESMDPPESYAQTVECDSHAEPIPAAKISTSKDPLSDFVRGLKKRFRRRNPTLDWVAICGLIATCFGLLLLIAGFGERRSEGVSVLGFCIILAGVVTSGVSLWRIRHSNGRLTGQKIASIGVLMLPLLLANAVLCVVLFSTPFGHFLGAITMAVALIYANYRLILYTMRWLASYSVLPVSTEPFKAEPTRDSSSDPGTLSGAIL